MERKKIILDCDPGMDDSMAIVMAAKSPALELLAVTTCTGNYPVEVTCVNARKMLELIGRQDIPVARGMAQPMVRPAPKDPFTHGIDGQAENFLPNPVMPLYEKDAMQLMIDLIRKHPGEITVLCTGPMTNLAMAMRIAPDIVEKLAGVIAISGAFGLNRYAFANAPFGHISFHSSGWNPDISRPWAACPAYSHIRGYRGHRPYPIHRRCRRPHRDRDKTPGRR